jgi:hypothetical protein
MNLKCLLKQFFVTYGTMGFFWVECIVFGTEFFQFETFLLPWAHHSASGRFMAIARWAICECRISAFVETQTNWMPSPTHKKEDASKRINIRRLVITMALEDFAEIF